MVIDTKREQLSAIVNAYQALGGGAGGLPTFMDPETGTIVPIETPLLIRPASRGPRICPFPLTPCQHPRLDSISPVGSRPETSSASSNRRRSNNEHRCAICTPCQIRRSLPRGSKAQAMPLLQMPLAVTCVPPQSPATGRFGVAWRESHPLLRRPATRLLTSLPWWCSRRALPLRHQPRLQDIVMHILHKLHVEY